MRKRNNNGRWTLPGGHLDEGEAPHTGALRELLEEAGIKVDDLKLLKKETVKKADMDINVYAYITFGEYDTDSSNDPDNEVNKWIWVDMEAGIPEEIKAKLHSNPNVTLNALGLEH
jgi:8-oxo-dGTP pyrophosphatase MutT (NUDIX family)